MIKVLIMDVDGTLTDGKLYIDKQGEACKVFHVRDGYAVVSLLPKYGIVPVVLTGRKSKIVRTRCEELGIIFLYEGVNEKETVLLKIIKEVSQVTGNEIRLKDCAYIGDDIPDYKCMRLIKHNQGMVGCPDDAVEVIRNLADYRSVKKGGEGCVRDFIEWILRNEGENIL